MSVHLHLLMYIYTVLVMPIDPYHQIKNIKIEKEITLCSYLQ